MIAVHFMRVFFRLFQEIPSTSWASGFQWTWICMQFQMSLQIDPLCEIHWILVTLKWSNALVHTHIYFHFVAVLFCRRYSTRDTISIPSPLDSFNFQRLARFFRSKHLIQIMYRLFDWCCKVTLVTKISKWIENERPIHLRSF